MKRTVKPKPRIRRAMARPAAPSPLPPPPVPTPRRLLLARRGDGLSPRTLNEAMQLAERLADSQLVPKDYRGKPGDILIAISLGHEVGLKWAQALQNIAVIGGRPTIWGNAGLGIVMSHPDYEWHKESDDESTETATCVMKRRGLDAVSRSFSQADAERIMVWERDAQGQMRQVRLADRPVWKAGYKKRMRQMRARWWCMNDTFADALKGIDGREWVEDDAAMFREEPSPRPALSAEELMPRRREDPPSGSDRPPEEPPSAPVPAKQPSPQPGPSMETAAAAGRPLQVAPGPSPVESPVQGTLIEINGRQLTTSGITKLTLLKAYKLGAQLDELEGKGQAKELLGRDFGLEHRHELTEEAGQKYLAALAVRVNHALARRR